MTTVERKALGRGLGALLPQSAQLGAFSKGAGGQLLSLPLDHLTLPESQPRTRFDEARLQELAQSIREKGVLQPILVARTGDRFTLIAGERRVRAARLAGHKLIPAVLKDACPDDVFELALIENIQREDLDPIEEARAYERLMSTGDRTQDEVARRVGKQRSTVANALRLLALPADIQELIGRGDLTAGHARALLAVEDEDARRVLLEEILAEGLSVREAERRARQGAKGPGKQRRKRGAAGPLSPLHDIIGRELSEELDCKVKVEPRSSRAGRIVIEYDSLDTLRRVHERFRPRPEEPSDT